MSGNEEFKTGGIMNGMDEVGWVGMGGNDGGRMSRARKILRGRGERLKGGKHRKL